MARSRSSGREASTIIRGHLENCADVFQINGGTLRLELDAPENFDVGDMSVYPTGTLSGRARLYDGSVFVDHGGRLRPDAMPGALSFGHLSLESESVLETPLIAGGAPILIPPRRESQPAGKRQPCRGEQKAAPFGKRKLLTQCVPTQYPS